MTNKRKTVCIICSNINNPSPSALVRAEKFRAMGYNVVFEKVGFQSPMHKDIVSYDEFFTRKPYFAHKSALRRLDGRRRK